MNYEAEWIKQTSGLLMELENERQTLLEKYQRMSQELTDLERKIQIGHELISDYMDRHKIESVAPSPINLASLANKSYPEMLVEIAKQSNDILNVSYTSDVLFNAKIGSDRKSIAHNVYGALSRLQQQGHFQKISRGQYRFTNHMQVNKKRERSGIKEAVKILKEQNPLMTVRDIIEHLKETGFDFKGKKPSQSVTMAWVSLGYSKEGKQQKLPIENSFVPRIETISESLSKVIPVSSN